MPLTGPRRDPGTHTDGWQPPAHQRPDRASLAVIAAALRRTLNRDALPTQQRAVLDQIHARQDR